MRKIGSKEIEDIALGAALLGAGGGGDPYIGKLVAMGAVRECGPVTLLDPGEVPDDALIVPIAMMGAPHDSGGKGNRRKRVSGAL
ncbi:S-methyl thiohydantoin desulfurase domain-containing protein [Blautia marasmi]|uniref:S-methyl thiohydantoin desulfurase domain-containing protein n=1 Tax=Blautia marasmi TaxID=1917868 RepID=UPI00351586A6